MSIRNANGKDILRLADDLMARYETKESGIQDNSFLKSNRVLETSIQNQSQEIQQQQSGLPSETHENEREGQDSKQEVKNKGQDQDSRDEENETELDPKQKKITSYLESTGVMTTTKRLAKMDKILTVYEQSSKKAQFHKEEIEDSQNDNLGVVKADNANKGEEKKSKLDDFDEDSEDSDVGENPEATDKESK